ncbi:sugar ABC transporter permease [Thermoanaerobacterium sp. PSU-2]|nr:carbohydrate ABC transporter permease [Thermoanaerobacterium sp. PSU-2]ORX22902.1 sugar ABC transporter permease [Thermoanaerobacterium sp. PSU-2]
MKNSVLNNIETNTKNIIFNIVKYFVVISFAMMSLFPFVWMVINAFKDNTQIYSSPFSLPKTFNFTNFIQAWYTANIGTYYFNSIIIAFSSVAVIIVLASMSSYILAMVRPNKFLYTYFTLGIMVPIHAMLIPTFIILRKFGLLNTRTGLAIVYSAAGLSLSIFILVGFMKGIPKEIEEAATIDGAGIFRRFFSIILPMSKTGIATIGTLAFINTWNDFLYAQVLISNQTLMTLTQGIYFLQGQYSTDYGLMSAGLVLAVIPVTIIYVLFQEQVVKGMTAGAVKG